jgi:hypothetical protein
MEGVPRKERSIHFTLSDAKTAFDIAFFRAFTSEETIEIFVMTFGRLCLEDFSDIVMACGHGYSVAGSKLLRALYEKTVTLSRFGKLEGSEMRGASRSEALNLQIICSHWRTIVVGKRSWTRMGPSRAAKQELPHPPGGVYYFATPPPANSAVLHRKFAK